MSHFCGGFTNTHTLTRFLFTAYEKKGWIIYMHVGRCTVEDNKKIYEWMGLDCSSPVNLEISPINLLKDRSFLACVISEHSPKGTRS